MVENIVAAALSKQRFLEFLSQLNEAGVSQTEVARRAGVPPQYITDIKGDRRSVTELFARRLEEEFGVDRSWLRGTGNDAEAARIPRVGAAAKTSQIRLPVFPHPILGEPYAQPTWDGSEIDVCGAALSRITAAEKPYVIRFGAQDVRGRLQKLDLILASQAVSHTAIIQILRSGKKTLLARRAEGQCWEPVVAINKIGDDAQIVGHCIGILWGPLTS